MSELDCRICFIPFNSGINLPRMLLCGHTICSQCLCDILENQKSCPSCRKETSSDNINDYAVNYILLEINDSTKKFLNAKDNFIQKYREKLENRQMEHRDLKIMLKSLKDNIDFNLGVADNNEEQLTSLLDTFDPFDRNWDLKIKEIDYTFETIRSHVDLHDSHLIKVVSLKSENYESSIKFLQEINKLIVLENKKMAALLRINCAIHFATLSIRDDILFIHTFERLLEKDDEFITVCFQDLQNVLLRSGKAKSLFGFLDLSYCEDGFFKRVIIEIDRAISDLGSQFLKLCSGELGVSYKGRQYSQLYGDKMTIANNYILSMDSIIQLKGINWDMKEVDNYSAYFLKQKVHKKRYVHNSINLSFNLDGSFNIIKFSDKYVDIEWSNLIIIGTILDPNNDFHSTFKDATTRKIVDCGMAVKF